MLANSVDKFSVENLQFNLVGHNAGNLDITQATNALKLENVENHAMAAGQSAGQVADDLGDFDQFLTEARANRDALAGTASPALPGPTTSATPTPSTTGASTQPSASDGAEASTWSVDKAANTINLDNGYSLKLNEANSEMLLEKRNESGELEKSTKIWGDPHLDAGNDGTNDADFWKDSTLALEDGTKITIGTRTQEGTDATFSDQLTITKGDQAVQVSGLMNGADALQIGDVTQNGVALDAQTNDGHVLVEGQGNDWQLQGGPTIGQNTEFVEFAKQEIDNEVRAGQAWLPDPDTVTARGGNADGMPQTAVGIPAGDGLGGGTATNGTGQPGAISDDLKAFLEMQGIQYEDEGGDGILSADEWDKLIAAMEDKQGGAGQAGQDNLSLLLQMKEMIAQMLEGLSLETGSVA